MLLYLLSKTCFLTSRRGRAADIKILGIKLLYFIDSFDSPEASNPNGRLFSESNLSCSFLGLESLSVNPDIESGDFGNA